MKDNKAAAMPVLAPVKGTVMAYGITAIVFIIYALLLTYTQISEKNNTAVVLTTLVIAIIFGGIKSAAAAKQRGLMWGILTGILYVAVMIGAGFFFVPNYTLGSKTLICLMLAVGSGGLGGIIGVNIFGRK